MRRLERTLVVLVALHSVCVGAALVLFPSQAVRFAGWGAVAPVFWAIQAGVFHLVLAAGYLLEHLRYRGVSLLVTAKAAAFVFLLGATLSRGVPWAVPFSAVADGAMGLAVFLVHRAALRRIGSGRSSERG